MNNTTLTSDLTLNRRQEAKAVGVCLTVFDRLDIPSVKIGIRVLYRKSTLEGWLKEQEERQNRKVTAGQGV